MVRVDDAPATVCICTELYAIITVQLHVSLFLNISILPQKVNIRRSHVLLYHCIIYCAAVYCIELSMYHYILKCKAEKLYMYSACFTFLSPELCASFREI